MQLALFVRKVPHPLGEPTPMHVAEPEHPGNSNTNRDKSKPLFCLLKEEGSMRDSCLSLSPHFFHDEGLQESSHAGVVTTPLLWRYVLLHDRCFTQGVHVCSDVA